MTKQQRVAAELSTFSMTAHKHRTKFSWGRRGWSSDKKTAFSYRLNPYIHLKSSYVENLIRTCATMVRRLCIHCS